VNKNRTTNLHDTKVDVKIVLSGLWIAMLFVFAYVDIFGFWRADVINGHSPARFLAPASRSANDFLPSPPSTSRSRASWSSPGPRHP